MLRYTIYLCAIFLISCTGTYEQNQARMDDLYGCKKPGENLSKEKYKACLAKERADGETFFDLEGSLNDLISGEKNVVYQYEWFCYEKDSYNYGTLVITEKRI